MEFRYGIEARLPPLRPALSAPLPSRLMRAAWAGVSLKAPAEIWAFWASSYAEAALSR